MTYYRRKPRVVKYPNDGPPLLRDLPKGTLSWADDGEAERWGDVLPLLGSDAESERTMKDGRRVTGYLFHGSVTGTESGPRQVSRIIWWDGERWIGRIYGSLLDAMSAWKKWLATTGEVDG